MSKILTQAERFPGETVRLLRGITGYAPAFRDAADTLLKGKEAE